MKLAWETGFCVNECLSNGKLHDQRSVGAKLGKKEKKQKRAQAIIESYYRVIRNIHSDKKSVVYRAILKEMQKRTDIKNDDLPSHRTIERRLKDAGIDLAKVLLSKKNNKK
jgi:hypothetical protein